MSIFFFELYLAYPPPPPQKKKKKKTTCFFQKFLCSFIFLLFSKFWKEKMLEKEQQKKNVSTSEKQQNRWFDHKNKNLVFLGGSFPQNRYSSTKKMLPCYLCTSLVVNGILEKNPPPPHTHAHTIRLWNLQTYTETIGVSMLVCALSSTAKLTVTIVLNVFNLPMVIGRLWTLFILHSVSNLD